jgi:hypothetical protein
LNSREISVSVPAKNIKICARAQIFAQIIPSIMQYLLILILLVYGSINLLYCASDINKVPTSIRFLLPKRIPSNRYVLLLSGIFSFIPETKRPMVLRLLMAAGCFLVAGQMIYVRFI